MIWVTSLIAAREPVEFNGKKKKQKMKLKCWSWRRRILLQRKLKSSCWSFLLFFLFFLILISYRVNVSCKHRPVHRGHRTNHDVRQKTCFVATYKGRHRRRHWAPGSNSQAITWEETRLYDGKIKFISHSNHQVNGSRVCRSSVIYRPLASHQFSAHFYQIKIQKHSIMSTPETPQHHRLYSNLFKNVDVLLGGEERQGEGGVGGQEEGAELPPSSLLTGV